MGKDGSNQSPSWLLHKLVILDDIQHADTIVQYNGQNFNYFNFLKSKQLFSFQKHTAATPRYLQDP